MCIRDSFVGSACAAAGHIFVDNSTPGRLKETLQKAETTLQNGMSLVVFPEGARTWTGAVSYTHLNAKGCDYHFDFIKYPAPKYQRAIKPVNESDAEKLSEILTRMHEEDPTWQIEQSKELKQTIVSGQGEFHLRTLKWRIENNDKLAVEFIEPRIPYRETDVYKRQM